MLEALKDYACRGGESKGEGLEPKCAACVPVLNGAADCLPPADRTPPHMEKPRNIAPGLFCFANVERGLS